MSDVKYSEDVIDILLVEDEPVEAEFARAALQTHMPRARITTKLDGRKALNYLSNFASSSDAGFPSVLILDINMPFLDGLGLLHIIRRDPVLDALPVIVLSGMTDDETARKAYLAGANAFVGKPDTQIGYLNVAQAIVDFWFHTAHPIGGMRVAV